MISMLIGLAIGATADCATDAKGFCTDKIVRASIGYGAGQAAVKINCALGDVVSIALPENVELRGDPALGNQAIFEFRAQTAPFRILVWPKYPANAANLEPSALYGERSNLQIFLDSGVTVLVDLQIGPPEKSVQELRLEFPERVRESEFLRLQMDAFARKLEGEYQAKRKALDTIGEEHARRRVARAMLNRVQCASLDERGMKDLLVVRAHRLCRLGDMMFVEFSIRNRARDVFHFGAVELAVAGADEGEAPIDIALEFSGEEFLFFNAELRGVATFSVVDNAKSYALTVRESGGKKRSVTVDGVEF